MTLEGTRIAPVRAGQRSLFRWARDGAYHMGHTGEVAQILDGDRDEYQEVLMAGIYGLLTQRTDEPSIIRLDGEELLKVENGELQLEAVFDDDGAVTVVYQRTVGSDQEQTTTLRRYNIETEEVAEIAEVGGWEASSYSDATFVELMGDGRRLLALRSSNEADEGLEIIDLDTGEWLPVGSWLSAGHDGDGAWLFDVVTIIGDELVGVASVWDEASGVVDRKGVYRIALADALSPTPIEPTLVATFEWDNGGWYPYDLGEQGIVNDSEPVLIINVATFGGRPYPAATVNLDTGEAWTFAEQGFDRLGYLS